MEENERGTLAEVSVFLFSESLFEAELEGDNRGALELAGAGSAPAEDGATAPAGRKALETVAAADAIVDALDLAEKEEEREGEHQEAEARAAQAACGGAR